MFYAIGLGCLFASAILASQEISPSDNRTTIDEPRITQENDPCDLRIETLKPLESGNESFYLKCEPTFVAKDNATMVIVGRWILYPCQNRTIDECIVAEKSSISKSIQSVLNLTFSDVPVPSVGFGPMPNTLLMNSDNACVSSPPSPGAQCCLSQSASESDLSNARYFFQCHPAEQGNNRGMWVRMECPPNAVFNSFLQTCTSVYSTVVNGSSFLSSAIVYDFPSCPDGSKTNLFCQAGICPRDYDCYNGGCCSKPALTIAMDPRVRKFCPDGLEATFPCRSNEECADGYTCAEIGSTSFCCREKHNALNLRQQFVSYQNNCPGPVTPYTSVLLCATGSQCPGGNVCPTAGFCCPGAGSSPTQPATVCLDGSTPLGPCLNGNCFAPGYGCQNGLCCKTGIAGPVLPQPGSGCSAPIAPTPNNPYINCVPGSICPNGSPCPSNGVCCTPGYQSCPDGSQSAGQCASNMQCVPGYTCQNGACCRSTSALCADGTAPYRPCYNGQCTDGYSCQQNYCCRNTVSGLCPDNSPAFGVCSPSGACGFGMSCTPNGLCCSTASQLCPDNSQPAGACINGFCGAGFACVANLNYCCRSSGSVAKLCLDGTEAVGYCINGQCGDQLECTTGNLCCARPGSTSVTPGKEKICPSTGLPSTETCVDNACVTAGYRCETRLQICCPSSTSIGTSLEVCGGLPSIGPCVNKLCPTGYKCNLKENQCCEDKAATGALSAADKLAAADFENFAYSPYSRLSRIRYPPPTSFYMGGEKELLCRSGVKPSGFCNDQVCPPQHKCEIGSNLCCPVFDSFSMNKGSTAAKPGDSCNIKYDCSGARFRLATCHYGVCICLAPAKPFRNTCVIPKKSKSPTTPQPMLDLDTFFQNEALNLSTTIKILPQRSPNACTNDTNCDAQLKQKCLSGRCVSPKRLGENCTSNSQCSLHCLSSTCKQLKSLPYKTCQCEQNLYLYKNVCVKKCPKGTNTKEAEFSCDDSPFSRSIRGTEAFHKDLKIKNVC